MHIRGCVFRHCSASLALPSSHLLCPLLTSPRYSAPVARRPASILRSTREISRGKTRYLPCIDAGFTKCTHSQMEGFAVTCPLAPDASRLISGFCSSSRSFGLGAPIDPASRRRPCPSPYLRLCMPGHRTFTDEVTRHARRTRSKSPDLARFYARGPVHCKVGPHRDGHLCSKAAATYHELHQRYPRSDPRTGTASRQSGEQSWVPLYHRHPCVGRQPSLPLGPSVH